ELRSDSVWLMLLYDVTNVLIAAVMPALSCETPSVVGLPLLVLRRLSVTPSIASVIVFELLLMSIPSILSLASCAACAWVRFLPEPALAVGSKASWDKPAASRLSPSSSLALILMLLAAPVSLEVNTSLLLVPSLMIVALTPILAALIASRTPERVLLEGSMVIVCAAFVPFNVKVFAELS